MKNENTKQHESIANDLIEDINQLENYALGEGPATCQICDRKLREGDELTAYAFRAAGNPIFDIGYVMCGADEHEHPTEFMRGVHELVVTGRIGLCTDVATQSSWLVLIAPEPVVESKPKSSSAHTIGEETTHDTTTPEERATSPFPDFDEVRERGVEETREITEYTDYSQVTRKYVDENGEEHREHPPQGGAE